MVPLNIPPTKIHGIRRNRRTTSRNALIVTIILFFLSMGLQACAPTKLTHVLVDDRLADPGEYYQVKIMLKDKSIQTKPGMTLSKNSVVETDGQTWAIIEFGKGTRVILKPNTRVRIASLTLIFGEIVAIIDKLNDLFEVKTEDVVAGPKSTVFTVSKASNGPSLVRVIRGAVQLTSPAGAWPAVTIKQYQRAETPPGGRPDIGTIKSDTFNQIIDWTNQAEKAADPSKASVLVPDIQSMQKDAALQVLERMGLGFGKVTPRVTSGRPPIGTVVEQRPAPGARVQPGQSIDVGVEVEPVEVPRLIDKPQSAARQLIARIGLTLGRVDHLITGKAKAETVIDQKPRAGEVVPKGTAVDLVVEEISVMVPNLRHLNKEAAMNALGNAQLTVGRWDEEITGSQPPHTVLRQNPGPNTRVRPETAVDLVAEAVSVIVPNLVGRHRNNVTAILGQEQLTQGNITERITGNHAAGIIYAQTPSPGKRVKPGTSIRLQVEAESVVVPNLVGLFRNTAGSALGGQKLRMGRVREELRENTRDGEILHQSPAQGQRVLPNTAVDLTFAISGVKVPNVNNQTRTNARNLLSKFNLSVGRVNQRETERVKVGRVMEQSPRSGTLVRKGSRVDIVLATRPSCYMPDIVTPSLMRPRDADRAIRNAGLVPRNRGNDYTERARVKTQNPRPGFKLFCGDTVEYTTVRIVY